MNYIGGFTCRRIFSLVGKIDESSLYQKKKLKILSPYLCLKDLINRTYSQTSTKTTINPKNKERCLESDDKSQMKRYSDFDRELINHLERNSLVDFDNEEAISRLQEAISFANTLAEVETDGVEPMTSTLENISLSLRVDKVDKTNRSDILINASLVEEDYFVAPPGNIPLEPQRK